MDPNTDIAAGYCWEFILCFERNMLDDIVPSAANSFFCILNTYTNPHRLVGFICL